MTKIQLNRGGQYSVKMCCKTYFIEINLCLLYFLFSFFLGVARVVHHWDGSFDGTALLNQSNELSQLIAPVRIKFI